MALPSYASSVITAIGGIQQNVPFPRFVMGGQNATTYKLFKKSSTYTFNNWRSQVFQIGKNFDVLSIRFAVLPDLTTNMSIIPVLYFDNQSSSSVGTTINSTNFANSLRLIYLTPKDFSNTVHGKHNFFLELQFQGSALAVVELPITIEVDIEEI